MIIPAMPWLRFAPYIMAGIAAVVLFGLGIRTGLHWSAGKVAKAEAQLSEFKTALAEAQAKGERDAAARQQAALEASAAHADAVNAAVAAIPSRVLKLMQRDVIPQLRETVNAPEYACLRLPLPDDYLRLLDRPGDPDTGG